MTFEQRVCEALRAVLDVASGSSTPQLRLEAAQRAREAVDAVAALVHERESNRQIRALLDANELLIQRNARLIAERALPKLYESGVRYAVGDGTLYDARRLLERGRGDVESLVALRCAELRAAGVDAQPFIRWRDLPGGGHAYTMVVRLPDGTVEDVAARVRERDGESA